MTDIAHNDQALLDTLTPEKIYADIIIRLQPFKEQPEYSRMVNDATLAARSLDDLCESLTYGRGIFCFPKDKNEYLLFHIADNYTLRQLELNLLTAIFGGHYNLKGYWAFIGDDHFQAFKELAEFIAEMKYADMSDRLILGLITDLHSF